MNPVKTNDNIFDALSDDLKNESSYGLEVIINEIIHEQYSHARHESSIDWFGLSDLSI